MVTGRGNGGSALPCCADTHIRLGDARRACQKWLAPSVRRQ
jgi:hypothetical protein